MNFMYSKRQHLVADIGIYIPLISELLLLRSRLVFLDMTKETRFDEKQQPNRHLYI